jgi:small-conductance mechanosensitive channel
MNEQVVILLSKLPMQEYVQNPYILAFGIVIFYVLLAKIIQFIFAKYLQHIAKKTKTTFDDLIFEYIKNPLFYLVAVYGLKIAVNIFQLPMWTNSIFKTVLAVIFVLILSRTVDAIIETWGQSFSKKTKTNIDEVLLPLSHKFVKIVFVLIVIMWILHIWGINITPYLAGAGILGVVLGLALQDSLKNILGGVMLILDETFKPGDKIKLESGEVGTIHEIGLRSTKLTTYDNEAIYVPNGNLANSRVQNYTRPDSRLRVNMEFHVEYGVDVKVVKKVVLQVLNTLDILTSPDPVVDFVSMEDFSLKFNAKFWVQSWDQAYGVKLKALEGIYDALNKAKITIPFPTRMIYTKKG